MNRMDDLISREEAFKVLSEYYHHKTKTQHDALWDALSKIPPVEPKTGRWVGVSPQTDTRQCSECGYNILSEEVKTPYCPWCGAKMEEQE